MGGLGLASRPLSDYRRTLVNVLCDHHRDCLQLCRLQEVPVMNGTSLARICCVPLLSNRPAILFHFHAAGTSAHTQRHAHI